MRNGEAQRLNQRKYCDAKLAYVPANTAAQVHIGACRAITVMSCTVPSAHVLVALRTQAVAMREESDRAFLMQRQEACRLKTDYVDTTYSHLSSSARQFHE